MSKKLPHWILISKDCDPTLKALVEAALGADCSNPECDEETCKECCPHDDMDHGICLDCEADLSDELCNAAHESMEGDR